MSSSGEFQSDSLAAAASLPCAEFADQLVAYAWGALEPQEWERVDRHRTQCAGCDRWLRDSEHVVSQLDEGLPKISPPAELRSRVLSTLDAIPQPMRSAPVPGHRAADAPIRPTRWTAEPSTGGVQPAVTAIGKHARPARRPAGWRASPFLAGLTTGLVGALAAAVFLFVLLVRPQDLSWLTPRQSAFGSESSRPAVPGLLPGSGAAAPSVRLLELRAASASGRGVLMYDTDTRRGVLLLEGVAAAAGSEYAVWLVQGSQHVQLGSLSVDARGVGTFVLPDPLPLDRPERIELTPVVTPGDASALPVFSAGF